MGFWRALDDKAATRLIYSSPVFTSTIIVQGHKRVNVDIIVGSRMSDMMSGMLMYRSVALGAAISGPLSTASCSLTLQRQAREFMGTDLGWEDVEDWSILKADGEAASEQNVTEPQPETCSFRFGCKTGQYESGCAMIRIGTT